MFEFKKINLATGNRTYNNVSKGREAACQPYITYFSRGRNACKQVFVTHTINDWILIRYTVYVEMDDMFNSLLPWICN